MNFILNRETLAVDAPPGRPLLDYLREDRGLTAAKAGCREGDCGACSVLLGRMEEGRLRYRLVNACLTPLSAAAGSHVLTVEGLGEHLNPAQRALVEEGGIQCGFCTPGMVMALTAHLLNSPRLDRAQLLEALDGNLCRCTGYQGILRAGKRLQKRLPGHRAMETLIEQGILPAWLPEIPARLAALPLAAEPEEPAAGETVLAGGTDMMLKGHPASPWNAGRHPELRGIRLTGGRVSLGAATTFTELLESEALAVALPEMHRALPHVASTPVRDRATVGGNLVNASPIGDLSVMLLALDAELLLHRHHEERRLPLSEFFLGYKRLALAPGEVLAAIEFEGPKGGFHFEKVAHRDHLDIASVNCALRLELEGFRVREVRLAAGGVAPMPLRLWQVEALLMGRELDSALVIEAANLAAVSVTPIDDVRGSARYKRLLLRQLILASFLALAPHLEPAALLDRKKF